MEEHVRVSDKGGDISELDLAREGVYVARNLAKHS